MGKRLSERCNRASSGRAIVVSVMVGDAGGGRERERRARGWNVLLLEEVFGASDIGADDSRWGGHQWPVAIGDAVRVEPPRLGRAGLDQERRLGPLNNKDDGLRLVQDVSGVGARRHRERVLAMDPLDDDQNRKYRCASGNTSAGSLVSSWP